MLNRIVHGISCRSILYIFGFWHIPTGYQRLSRRHELPKIYPPGLNIASGDLIVCNKLSYIEILYLGFRYVYLINLSQEKLKNFVLDLLLHSLQLALMENKLNPLEYLQHFLILLDYEKFIHQTIPMNPYKIF